MQPHVSVPALDLSGSPLAQLNSLSSLLLPLPPQLVGLTTLFLTRCALSDLPVDVIAALPSLTHLNLSFNALTAIPEQLSSLQNLEILSLAGNRLTGLPERLFDGLTALTSLDLASNMLTELPASFSTLPSLRQLFLGDFSAGNLLSAIPAGLAQMTTLEELVLSRQHLKTLDDLPSLPRLRRLDVAVNQITALPDVLPDFPNLESISIALNPIQQLPSTFLDHYPKLTELLLGFTSLTAFPGQALPGMLKLKKLCASGAPVAAAPLDLPLGTRWHRVAQQPPSLMDIAAARVISLLAPIDSLPDSVVQFILSRQRCQACGLPLFDSSRFAFRTTIPIINIPYVFSFDLCPTTTCRDNIEQIGLAVRAHSRAASAAGSEAGHRAPRPQPRRASRP
eukprot:TRINITY_DN1215_c0_g1_i5.p1 TRINITY_DN1215_c0_g1~~TRINITY_DN1215_c0_g1_i5.p1  ORF type:complete len:438 (-),score=68.40 TRINITY_DN1215_c0_g1_i5:154-1338(-)